MKNSLYQPSQLISEAKLDYYLKNGLSLDGGVNDRWAYAVFAGIRLRGFPNSRSRMEALRRHDLHHLINDCSTSQMDEALVAAWELGSGCRHYWAAWWLDLQAMGFGSIFLSPKKCLQRFVLGRNSRNFFYEPLDSSLSSLTVLQLREKMLPTQIPITKISDISLFAIYTWIGLLTIVFSIPIYLLFILIGAIVGDGKSVEIK